MGVPKTQPANLNDALSVKLTDTAWLKQGENTRKTIMRHTFTEIARAV